jgi:eukaryotic-like serine/threonine-protein kinase
MNASKMSNDAEDTCDDGDEALELELARSYHQQRKQDGVRPATFAPGELLADRFSVERLLSRGGMGEVYVTFDRMLRQRVAIKVMLATMADDDRAVRRLCQEVRMARRIRHPHVCGVYDVGVHELDRRDKCYFMTMDHVDGQTLRGWASQRMLAIATVGRIMRQVLSALDAVHSAGIAHADVKADNIMITGEPGSERAILIDFGLARRIREQREPTRPIMVGTMGYMAPELVDGSAASVRADIYSVGVVLFEMLAGRLPFARESTLPSEPPALGALRPDVPPKLDALIRRCLRNSPGERYPSIEALAVALDDVLGAARFRPGRTDE